MRSLLPVLLFLLIAGVDAAPPVTEADARAAIERNLDELHEAAASADGPRYFALFAQDAVFLGTDAGERWSLTQFREYAEPYFAKGQGWVYRPRERSVVFAPIPCRCVAWFDELLDGESYGTSRGTGVLVLEGGEWRIAQYALTFPIPNALAKELTAKIRAFESAGANTP